MGKDLPTYMRLRGGGNHERIMSRGSADKIRKGYVPVLVGREGNYIEKMWLPTKLICHPSIVALLNSSADEFGYAPQGLLKISQEIDQFKRMIKTISKNNL